MVKMLLSDLLYHISQRIATVKKIWIRPPPGYPARKRSLAILSIDKEINMVYNIHIKQIGLIKFTCMKGLKKMSNPSIDKAIYDKYIKPTKEDHGKNIGIEIEMPIVNLDKAPVEEEVVFEMSEAFREHFGFEPAGTDADGHVNSMLESATGDDLSFDCAYSNLELSMGKGEQLFEIKERFEKYYLFINDFFSGYNYTLTGMGVNPHCNINHNKPIPNERYRMLYHYLHSYKKHQGGRDLRVFHDRPDFGTFTSASQVQLDVRYDELIDVINTFGRVEPYKALLFANSYLPDYPELLCSRNMLWEHSMQGYNPHNIGMFEYTLKDADDLLEYIKSTSIYCTMRQGKYVDFTPVPIGEYFELSSVRGEYFDGERYRETEIIPEAEDLQYLRSFKFEDLTYRGTIEFRSCCCQPVSDSMTVAAFHVGLKENLQKLKQLLENDRVIYSHGFGAPELQRLFSYRKLPSFADKKQLSQRLEEILDLAAEGLKGRGFGEESLLRPLYDRARELTNPARKMLEGLEKGETMEKYIMEYSKV